MTDQTGINLDESLFYDKYFVIKKSRATQLANEAVRILTEEMVPGAGESLEIVDILERMCDLQSKQYFCLNLDEAASLEAMKTYYLSKYDRDVAERCIEHIMKKEVGRELVFKAKCLVRGKVVDVWHHPDGGKVFEVRDRDNKTHTVPESWVVKWLDPENNTPQPDSLFPPTPKDDDDNDLL